MCEICDLSILEQELKDEGNYAEDDHWRRKRHADEFDDGFDYTHR